MKDKCYICETGNLNKLKVDYFLYGTSLGKFDAEVCDKCGETFFDEKVSKKMTEIAKKKGLWGLQAKTKIGQAGTALDIRLPKRIIDFLNLKKGKEVEIYPEGKNKLIITV
ncbi:YgiT-type zinc finger protein [Candidatus Woesearchaeota archaeon]|nr:YgiT-type zinc finger protein [Candidatus Woesearchaeota archaeon]